MKDLTKIQTGSVVDGFHVGEKIHEGGMALIYRVQREGSQFPMLMKVPRLEFGSHPSCYVGFEVEQIIMEVLNGPHVPRWVAKGSLQDTPYLVMEFIAGKSLRDYSDRVPLSAEEAARIIAALATAVYNLHQQEVIHLDIKPANVLLRPDGAAVLVDFGLAHHAHFPDLVEEEFHQPVGTSAYISPEQILGNRNEPRSDLFSLGVILYQLCTGHLPFGEPGTLSGFRRRLFLDPVPPRRRNPNLPAWMQEIILHCLEIEADKRYASAAQLAFDLGHPDDVPLTERANRFKSAGLVTLARRWWKGWQMLHNDSASPIAHLSQASQIMVALDPAIGQEILLQEILKVVQRVVSADSLSRIICVSVLEPDITTEQDSGTEMTNNLYTQRLIVMHHWAEGLMLPAYRLRFHVLQGVNPAATLLEYANMNHVEHVIIGARGSSALRRILGSVSTRVVTEALCSVTVVRQPGNNK